MLNEQNWELFKNRHIGPDSAETIEMLKTIGVNSLNELIDKTVPKGIRLEKPLELGKNLTEFEFLRHLSEIASKNKVFRSYIGMGYYPTILPGVIKRNILENPGWYTQYTPYQAEISQGRLEALINFQTMVSDLTGMEISNASLLDEGTSSAEAMAMLHATRKTLKKNSNTFIIDSEIFPQTKSVIKLRAGKLGIKIKELKLTPDFIFNQEDFAVLLQYPDNNGEIRDLSKLISNMKSQGLTVCVASDLLALTLLTPPGELGADVVVGSAQRFGVPMGYGGPHAAYFATKEEYKRFLPGRIIGVSQDASGKPAYRMALQTREQHIKREKATSNICTAQVLLAIMSGMYSVYHGKEGLVRIAKRINSLTNLLQSALKQIAYELPNKYYFDTLKIKTSSQAETKKIREIALKNKINFRYFNDGSIGLSLSEYDGMEDISQIAEIFASARDTQIDIDSILTNSKNASIPENLERSSPFLEHPVFNSYRSETEMLRYIKKLEKKDLSLTTSMIPLGSCTMKLNASTEMFGITWPEFAELHPFIPEDQAEGYQYIFDELKCQLNEITGFNGVSLQPNSGAQGEYTGLMVIRAYQEHFGQGHRDIVLIPSSAHGTNPASAVMAGCKVVIVKCDDMGNIDVVDLKSRAEQFKENLSALMVTYPSTHGVFEESIREICEIVHSFGGQVYMDGANLNAQVGLTSPAAIGADVCHMNLHKTFCIPHGGGGPGMGPIAVKEHLSPFLPAHPVIKTGGEHGIDPVSAAPYGSASILIISYAYIKMMGGDGLTEATKYAILNANYIKKKLEGKYKTLYTGKNGHVAHEMIFDLREFKHSANIEAEDVAKRLMDYGYHAPTVSFPVAGTIMIEPTESESKSELDRFCDAMISIRKEIMEIEDGSLDKNDNMLKNAPHTAESVLADDWNHGYSRKRASFPLPWVVESKFWPSVSRVDNAYGDRNLMCSCLPISQYAETEA